ncbi:MAG: thrombospondin type 3 repeat-containing protein [Phycisphaerales bacterium]|nr:MAG: thrombospondin type 3 repeat-containing protein [Phycisphaerales bacterium]
MYMYARCGVVLAALAALMWCPPPGQAAVLTERGVDADTAQREGPQELAQPVQGEFARGCFSGAAAERVSSTWEVKQAVAVEESEVLRQSMREAGGARGPAALCPDAIDAGILPDDGLYGIPGDTTDGGNNYEHPGSACGDLGVGGEDQIWEFMVASTGAWMFGTCYNGDPYASFDTSLVIYEYDGDCPGTEVACDGDFCGSAALYTSLIEQAFLEAGTTYYLVVDGWSTLTYGTYTWLFEYSACESDADCDDGLACNGAETCWVATGECVGGLPPCEPFQECLEPTGECVNPDPCLSWLAGSGAGSFYPQGNYCAGASTWFGDDIELADGAGRELISYSFRIVARDINQDGTTDVGTPYIVETALATLNTDDTCLPYDLVVGAGCVLDEFQIQPNGTPPDTVLCEPNGGFPTGIILPDNSGIPTTCDADFFMMFRVDTDGAGFEIALAEQTIGGPALDDDFGESVFVQEECPPPGLFGHAAFTEPYVSDFAGAMVCTVPPTGACCTADEVCMEDMGRLECELEYQGGFQSGGTCADCPYLLPVVGIQQMDVMLGEPPQPVANTDWGVLTISVSDLVERTGIGAGFVNMYTDLGWVVQNVWVDGSDGTETITAYFDLGTSVGVGIAGLLASVEYTVEPVPDPAARRDPLGGFYVGGMTYSAQGVGLALATVLGPPPAPWAISFPPGAGTWAHTQPNAVNVQTACNQCFPMAIANSLEYLDNRYAKVTMPHNHVLGLKGDSSLVGQLDTYGNRAVTSRRSGSGMWFVPMISGKFDYLNSNSLAKAFAHAYQGRGWGGAGNALPAGDYTAHGITAKDQSVSNNVTWQWIRDELMDGYDVELVYSRDDAFGNPTGGHAVRLFEVGETLGADWVGYLHDTAQTNVDLTDSVGLTTTREYLTDMDGDGIPNLGSANREVRFVFSEAPTGACCFAANACTEMTLRDCNATAPTPPPGKTAFRGEGTKCPTQNVRTNSHRGVAIVHWTTPGLDCYNITKRGDRDACGDLIDAWMTADEGHDICHQFGVEGSPPIPAGFFGTGSDPYGDPVAQEVCLQGEPLGPTDWGDFETADTLIWRSEDPFGRCELPTGGEERQVDIEIVALNLKSIDPIIVTYNGGQNPEEWDVHVTLSDVVPEEQSTLTARRGECNGGTYETALYVMPRFEFTKVSDPGVVEVLDTGDEGYDSIPLLQDEDQWVVDADPNLNLEAPAWCTAFHPGVVDPEPTTDCDCNANGIRDACDPDCDGDGIPNDCDPDICLTPFRPDLPDEWIHAQRKHRYLSIDPTTNGSDDLALRVELTELWRCENDLRRSCRTDADCSGVCDNDKDRTCVTDAQCPGSFCVAGGASTNCVAHPSVGHTKWVQDPMQEPAGCRLPGGCTDTDWFAGLGDDPFVRDWSDFGVSDSSVLHISDCGIIPVATYHVRFCVPPTYDICSEPLEIGTILLPPPSNFGDVVGPVDPVTIEFDPPNQIPSVGDISGYLLTNQNYGLPGDPKPQAHWTWVDLEGFGWPLYHPQGILNVSDLAQILFGLEGRPWSWPGKNVDPDDCL